MAKKLIKYIKEQFYPFSFTKKKNRFQRMENKEKDFQEEALDSTQENEGVEATTQEADPAEKEQGGPEAQIEKMKQENSELKDKYLRLFAEFDNYKKRTVKEKLDMMKTASASTMQALLPVLDDFDRAKKNAEDDKTTEVFSEGVNLVYQKLYGTLKTKGLKPMDSNGQVFDPELHEAITEIPAPTDDLKGKIVDTVERGYFLNDKIIRHAKVVVGR